MARAIDADLALHTLSVYSATEMVTWERTKDVAKGYDASAVTVGYMQGIKDALAVLHDMPTIEAEPVKHGKWVGLEYDGYADGYPVWEVWECSECGDEIRTEEPPCFCCNCGARMDGEKE